MAKGLEDARRGRLDVVQVAVVAICIGMAIAWASLQLRFDSRTDTIHNLAAVLNGQPLLFKGSSAGSLPFYNRVLFPLAHEGLAYAFPILSEGQWYLLLRQLSFALAFLAFGLVCLKGLGASRRQVMLSMALLALAVLITFNHPWEDPSDALDLLGLALGVGAALANRFLLCALVAIVFAANRESAAFLGIVWYFVAPSTGTTSAGPRRLLQSIAISVASYGATLAIRFVNPAPEMGQNHFNLIGNIRHFTNVQEWQLHPMGVPAMLLAATILLLVNVDRTAPRARRFLWIAAVLLAPVMLFGALNELRVYLPNILMAAFAVAASESGGDRPA